MNNLELHAENIDSDKLIEDMLTFFEFWLYMVLSLIWKRGRLVWKMHNPCGCAVDSCSNCVLLKIAQIAYEYGSETATSEHV